MMKSIPIGKGLTSHVLSDGQQATLLTETCSCGNELRKGMIGGTCKRCGGAIVKPVAEP